MPKGVMRFRNMTIARQQGELARFRVLGGPDNGVVFVITAPKISLGRGEENELVLSDIKTSRKHAEITIGAGGVAFLRDLGSTHGLIINGVPQRQAQLRNGDKVGLGESVLEFIGTEPGATQMIVRPPAATSSAIGTGASGLTRFIQRPVGPGVGASGGAGPKAAQQPTFLERNKKLMLMLGALMVVAGLLPEVEQKQKAKRNKYADPAEMEGSRGLSSLQPPLADPKVVKNSDAYFKEGFREFRARNYVRAQMNFETALQIYSDHPLARIYLESTKKAMEEEAEEHFKTAKRDEEAYRLRGAAVHYDAVKRLFAKDQSNPKFKQADTRAAELEKKIKDSE